MYIDELFVTGGVADITKYVWVAWLNCIVSGGKTMQKYQEK